MADELNRYGGISFSPIASNGKHSRRSLPSDHGSYFNPTSNQRLLNSTPNIIHSRRFQDLNLNNNNLSNYGTCGLFGSRTSFGTPSYPSPLDRIRNAHLERAAHIGSDKKNEASFEINQSFPKVTKSNMCLHETMKKPKLRSDFIYDGVCDLRQVSYSPGHSKGSFQVCAEDVMNTSSRENWSFYNYIGGGETGMVFPTTVNNPNKAICTINAKTSEILVANEMACELFGFDSEELIGEELKKLIKLKPKDQETILESHLEDTGEVVSVSGRVVDALDRNGLVMPISLWVKQIGSVKDCRCFVVMEPVDRTVAMVTFDSQGTVLSCDHKLAYLHGFVSPDDVEGLQLRDLIPSVRLPQKGERLDKELRKQRATGRTQHGASFPLSIFIKLGSEVEEDSRNVPPRGTLNGSDGIYLGIIWVFSSISGLITLSSEGSIQTINDNFALLLFGYTASNLIGKDISELIPDFYDIMELESSDCELPVRDREDDLEGDSSDDQGIGSSLTSSQGTKQDTTKPDRMLDRKLDNLCTLTSTPNKPLPDTYFRKAMDQEKSTGQEHLPLILHVLNKDPLVTKLDLTSDSEDEVPPPVCRLNALSPTSCNSADVSSSSTETVPTAREVICNATGQVASYRSVTTSSEQATENQQLTNSHVSLPKASKCVASQHKEYSQADIQVLERLMLDDIVSQDGGKSSEQNDSILSTTSTEELICAKIRTIDLNDSEGKLNGSVVSDQLDLGDSASSSVKLTESDASLDSFIRNEQELSPASQGQENVCNISGNDSGKGVEMDMSDGLPNHKELSSQQKSQLRSNVSNSDKTQFSSEQNSLNSSLENVLEKSEEAVFSPCKAYRGSNQIHGRCQTGSDFSSQVLFPEGSYAGQCKHQDGSYLGIIFQLKRVVLTDGSVQYCMWVSRDPEEVAEGGRSYANLTLASSLSSTVDRSNLSFDRSNLSNNFSLGEILSDKAHSESKVHHHSEHDSEEDCNKENEDPSTPSPVQEGPSPGHGLYDLKYETFNSIGKGAFGFVKLACRKMDNQQVVVKFIKKNKVLSECWTRDSKGRTEPLEVSLLRTVNHPNIVKVLDVMENDDYIQMVMEKHGSGMDLFEFIDRAPLLDEALASYIFRQMVLAVSYLHGLGILHRDIKDENVILNENFHIKLIDFGAAAYMYPGKLFGTFCGTMEYCSPEVLMGNRYPGPELEVWSMGVTLYTLIFGENPFFDVDETIKGELKPPFEVSRALTHLLMWLLNRDPKRRATVQDCERDLWTNQPIDISQYSWREVLPNSEFHGNTAADNRIDSPETKVHQNYNKSKGPPQVYSQDAYFKPHPAYSPPGYDVHIGGRPWQNEIPY